MDSQRRRPLDQAPPLDPHLAERVLSGAATPEDLPPALGPLAEVIGALRADAVQTQVTPAGPTSQKDRAAIDSMVTALTDPSSPVGRRRHWVRLPSSSPIPRRLGGVRVRLATSMVAVVLAFLVGTAYAGALPGQAQNMASIVLSKVGLNVPGTDTNEESGDQGHEQDRHGPDPTGPAHFGLCNAYFHGNGGTQGGKNDSTAFQNLVDAAGEASQSVDEFCGVHVGAEQGGDHGNNGKGHDSEESDDQDENEQESDDQGQDEQGSKQHGSDHEHNGNHDSDGHDVESGD